MPSVTSDHAAPERWGASMADAALGRTCCTLSSAFVREYVVRGVRNPDKNPREKKIYVR